MTNTLSDKQMRRVVDARIRKVGRAFLKAGIKANPERKLQVLGHLLVNGLAGKQLDYWPRSSTLAHRLQKGQIA
jgi:hypothetical protein